MLAKITKKVTLTVEPGSIVNISEGQFKALGNKAETYKVEAKEVEEKKEESKEEPKTTTSKKTSSRKKKSED